MSRFGIGAYGRWEGGGERAGCGEEAYVCLICCGIYDCYEDGAYVSCKGKCVFFSLCIYNKRHRENLVAVSFSTSISAVLHREISTAPEAVSKYAHSSQGTRLVYLYKEG